MGLDVEYTTGNFNYFTVHCCRCEGMCNHTGGPYYCNMHNPNYTPPTWTINTWPSYDSELHEKLDKIIKLLERLVK